MSLSSVFRLGVALPCTLALLLTGCGGPEEGDDEGGIGDGQTGVGGDGGDGGDDGATDDPFGDDDEVFDVGGGGSTGGDGNPDLDESCKKVDLLFVIDNSGSMADEQENLVSSFPGFIDSIQTELADTDGYHIGVVTSDAYAFNESGCTSLGALVTQTGGTSSSNGDCGPFNSGARYMDETDDLTQSFSCAGQVGTGGDGNEQPMGALTAAISDPMNGAGGCNEGFLRDDALLVVVIITDEEDDHETDGCNQLPQPGSNGDPSGWYEAVVAAKGNQPKNIVVLSLVGPDGNNACPPLDKCSGGINGAEVATRIIEFTQMFPNGSIGQVCAPDYGPFFQNAVSIINSACDDFTPPE